MTTTNETKHQTTNPLLRMALRRFFATLNQIMPDVDTIIDAGCGEGYAAKQILTAHPQARIFGVDLSETAVQSTSTIAPELRAGIADVTRMPFSAESADLVMSLEVLEHLPQPEAALRDYVRVSRRYVLLSVPNEPIFRITRMLRGLDVAQFGDHPEHLQHWNYFTFQGFARQSGLRVIHAWMPFPFAWVILLCEKIT